MADEFTIKNIEDVVEGDRILPSGWYRYLEVLAVEDTSVPEMVNVLWFVGHDTRAPVPWPPGPNTYFMRGEKVEVTR